MRLPSWSTRPRRPGSMKMVASGCSRMAGASTIAPAGRSSRDQICVSRQRAVEPAPAACPLRPLDRRLRPRREDRKIERRTAADRRHAQRHDPDRQCPATAGRRTRYRPSRKRVTDHRLADAGVPFCSVIGSGTGDRVGLAEIVHVEFDTSRRSRSTVMPAARNDGTRLLARRHHAALERGGVDAVEHARLSVCT